MGLLQRTAGIWRTLDRDTVLERFLSVWDDGLDRAKANIDGLYALRSVDEIPDRWLPLLGPLVGHEWRTDQSRAWNRAAISRAIRAASYKGTMAAFHDCVIRNRGTFWSHIDMASQIIVPGSQGYLGSTSSYLMGPNLYHPGAHKFFVDEQVLETDFEAEIERIRPAGEVWFIYYLSTISEVFGADWAFAQSSAIISTINYSDGDLGSGLLGRIYLGQTFLEPFDSICMMDSEVLD